MESKVATYAEDFRVLVRAAARAGRFADPVAFDPDEFEEPLLKASRRGDFVPIDGALIRDWDRDYRRTWPGVNFGLRIYHLGAIPFVRVYTSYTLKAAYGGYDFLVCDRADYRRLFREAVRLRRASKPDRLPPVMAPEVERVLWQNTIGFLKAKNLTLLRRLGGRAKRGILLTGPPGNGKTSACRWVFEECVRRDWEYRLVSADDYQAARRDDDPTEAVRRLFKVSRPGVVFFDDLDIALRDRNTVKETDDQSVFLTSLDGIHGVDAVVYVFTTNCPVDLIDPAFRRPGRIDLTLHFPKPTVELRTRLIGRWDPDIRAAVPVDRVATETAGLTFAEIEELKNLLVLHFLDTGQWDWPEAVRQFRTNRAGFDMDRRGRRVGFGIAPAEETVLNGQPVCN
jgi:hypothetical protein